MAKILIAPSILSADFSHLSDQVAQVEKAGADWLHLDVMDGHFVPNITIGPPVIHSLRAMTKLQFDTHLMIENADAYLESFREAGADGITVHYEACVHLNRTVRRIKDLGARAGVCINPSTPVGMLKEIIRDVELVLIMSVNPGFGGQTFIPATVAKIRETAAMIRDLNPDVYLEVDGGIDESTAGLVMEAGANVLVSGNYVFRSGSIAKSIASLRGRAQSKAGT